jgi:hypothetical protein
MIEILAIIRQRLSRGTFMLTSNDQQVKNMTRITTSIQQKHPVASLVGKQATKHSSTGLRYQGVKNTASCT